MTDWDGKAASAASTYFLNLADELIDQKANFHDIAKRDDTTAFGVKELANACGSLVESAADWAIAIGITLAAAATNFWNPVGWGAGVGAGYSIYRGAKVVKEILEIRAKVWNGVSDDRQLRRRIDDVLAGRASLRDLARSADFTSAEAHTPPPNNTPTRHDDPGTW